MGNSQLGQQEGPKPYNAKSAVKTWKGASCVYKIGWSAFETGKRGAFVLYDKLACSSIDDIWIQTTKRRCPSIIEWFHSTKMIGGAVQSRCNQTLAKRSHHHSKCSKTQHLTRLLYKGAQ